MPLGDADSECLRRLCLSWQPGSVFEELTKANCFQVHLCVHWQKASVSHHISLFIEFRLIWWLASPREWWEWGVGERKERKEKRGEGRGKSRREAVVFDNWISEVTSHHFCHTLLVTQTNCFSVRGDYRRMWIPGGGRDIADHLRGWLPQWLLE